MKKLLMLSYWGAVLLFTVAPFAAQNSVDVLNNGPQPANTVGCAVNPQCIPAVWSTTSNAGTDIGTPISANFVFDSNGGALPTDFPSATSGRICLADTRDLTGTTLFGQIAANCQVAGGTALLLIRNSASENVQNCDFLKENFENRLPVPLGANYIVMTPGKEARPENQVSEREDRENPASRLRNSGAPISVTTAAAMRTTSYGPSV